MPDDYKYFIINYGVCSPDQEIEFKPFKEEAEYNNPAELGIPNFDFHGSRVGVFFGNEEDDYDIPIVKLRLIDALFQAILLL